MRRVGRHSEGEAALAGALRECLHAAVVLVAAAVEDRRVDARGLRALGERGPVWWTDGAPDLGRRMARNTPYAEWFRMLGEADDRG